MTPFSEYLAAIRKKLALGDATEQTHRAALENLLDAVGKGIAATNEPRRIACGAPDFNITRNKVPLGHIETKDIGVNLDDMERGKGPNGEQFKRYLVLPNWILTDYLEFRWFVTGEKRLTARLAELDAQGKIRVLPDGEQKLGQLLQMFFVQPALTVGTAKEFAERMAQMTRNVRDPIVATFEHGSASDKGWLENWLTAFREVLIPDLDEKQFADMFAQTLAYGLFAARVNSPAGKSFSREMAAFCLPKTNPFLRKLFAEFAGVDMPETFAWAVDDIVELLKHAAMSEVLRDFGKGKAKEDPVVHFYETFLKAYDPKTRELRGVYYTPEPVVSYIVRSIDHLLKTRFGRPKGLADENTLVLDPATGTATFLYFVVRHIYEHFASQKGAWDSYVAHHLLNRLFGFELLMAPYAIAHLKLGLELQETGYKFGSDQRLGIYLTNTLEEAAKKGEKLFAKWISDEASEAAEIKRDRPILAILGNPPYSGHSANRSRDDNGHLTFIGKLIEDYKTVDGKPLGEKNPKWLHDDYVKFIRFAQWRIDRTGYGVLGLITNHSYLDNPTFRGMRQRLTQSFSEIFVYNLHGNSKKRERVPGDGQDQNVFDIQQGVAIILAVKKQGKTPSATVRHFDLWGSQEDKYAVLAEHDVHDTPWVDLAPSSPTYLFVPQKVTRLKEYERGWTLTDAMPLNVLGFQSHRDHFAVDFDEKTLRERIGQLRDSKRTDDDLRQGYGLTDNRDWQLVTAREQVRRDPSWKNKLLRCLYRPFDSRYCYFSTVAMDYPRRELLEHVAGRANLCLNAVRQTKMPFWAHAVVSDVPTPAVYVELKDGSNAFPLYLYRDKLRPTLQRALWTEADSADSPERRPNLDGAFVAEIETRSGLRFVPDGKGDLRKTFGPEDVLSYIYAVFHSPTYRKRYVEFLKTDFPRVPLTSNRDVFLHLVEKGNNLVALHLMESPTLQTLITTFPERGSNAVEKVTYFDQIRRVAINGVQYFQGVPHELWKFHVGGYQVLDKWLKDRKGRTLTWDDIQHYQKIVVALKETIRLMKEIDAAIPKWPIE
jgi:predicted helicase